MDVSLELWNTDDLSSLGENYAPHARTRGLQELFVLRNGGYLLVISAG